VQVWVPLFHCKTKTHFEGTWRVDELPPEAEFFREAACKRRTDKALFGRTGRKTKKTLRQKRRKKRKSTL